MLHPTLFRNLLCLSLILGLLTGAQAAPSLTEPFEPGGYPAYLALEPVAPLQMRFAGDPLEIAPGYVAVCGFSHLFIYRQASENQSPPIAGLDLNGQCQNLAAVAEGILLVQGTDSFTLVDVGQIEAPRQVSRVWLPDELAALYWLGPAVFGRQSDGETAVYDVTNPVSPRFVRSLSLGAILGSWDGYLITDQGTQVCTYALGDPFDPRRVACQALAATSPAKQVEHYLYLFAMLDHGSYLEYTLQVMDIADPLHPALIQELDNDPFYGIESDGIVSLAVSAQAVYLSTGRDVTTYARQPDGTLQFVSDIDWDVFSHVLEGSAVSGNQLWVVNQDVIPRFGLANFPDIARLSQIQGSTFDWCVGCLDFDAPLGTFWDGTYAYFYQFYPGEPPVFLSRVEPGCLVQMMCSSIDGVAVSGDLAYLMTSSASIYPEPTYHLSIRALWSEPGDQIVGGIEIPYAGGPAHLEVQDNLAFYLTRTGVQLVNVSNPAQPELDQLLPGSYLEFAVEGRYLYLLKSDILDVADIHAAGGPQIIETVALPAALIEPRGVAVTPTALVVGGWVFDRQDPTHPLYAADLPGRAGCPQPQAMDRYVFCAGEPMVFDLIEPAAPRRLGQMAHSSAYMQTNGPWMLTETGLHRLPNLPAAPTSQTLSPNLPASVPLHGLSGSLGELHVPAGAITPATNMTASLTLATAPLVAGQRALSDVLSVQADPVFSVLDRPIGVKLRLRLPVIDGAGAARLYRLAGDSWEPADNDCPAAGSGEVRNGDFYGGICSTGTYIVLATANSLHLPLVHMRSGQ